MTADIVDFFYLFGVFKSLICYPWQYLDLEDLEDLDRGLRDRSHVCNLANVADRRIEVDYLQQQVGICSMSAVFRRIADLANRIYRTQMMQIAICLPCMRPYLALPNLANRRIEIDET